MTFIINSSCYLTHSWCNGRYQCLDLDNSILRQEEASVAQPVCHQCRNCFSDFPEYRAILNKSSSTFTSAFNIWPLIKNTLGHCLSNYLQWKTCISYPPLCYPQISQLKSIHVYYLTVPVNQESRSKLVECFWLWVFLEGIVKLRARAKVICRELCFQAHSCGGWQSQFLMTIGI